MVDLHNQQHKHCDGKAQVYPSGNTQDAGSSMESIGLGRMRKVAVTSDSRLSLHMGAVYESGSACEQENHKEQ